MEHAHPERFDLNRAPRADDLKKIIVFLTDGVNAQNRWSTDSQEIDAKTLTTCANIKAAGIRIYTIRVINGNDALLLDCASDPSMFFDVSNSDKLAPMFQQIVQNFNKLRLSR